MHPEKSKTSNGKADFHLKISFIHLVNLSFNTGYIFIEEGGRDNGGI